MRPAQSRTIRIAIGQIAQESNSFVSVPTELSSFQNSYLYEGDDIWSLAGSDTEVAGFLTTCERERAEIVPLVATRSVSGGPLSTTCYVALKEMLVQRLFAAGPIDGILLSMHGSMLAFEEDDPEGNLLSAVREVVGNRIPIIATLDLHANVTPRMVQHATALVAYTQYPHDDTRTTGERGASLLFRLLRGEAAATMALARVPMLVSGCEGQTFGDAPMAHLARRARELEADPKILSVSCFHVHPYLDIERLGCGALVVTNADPVLANNTARALAEEFWSRRQEFMPEVLSVAEAIERGRQIAGGPVLLIDSADCTGGGAAGDSAALLSELLKLRVSEPTYLMVIDPAAAAACAHVGIGQEVSLELGHHLDPTWGQPVPITGQVCLLCDGRFRYGGGAYGGTTASMGLSAVLQIGGIRALVMSNPTYDWADEQFRAAGLDPRQAKFIGVKNPMNYRFAYRHIAKAAFVVDLPGPTPPHVFQLPYQRLQRPVFPFDDDFPEPLVETVQPDLPHPRRN